MELKWLDDYLALIEAGTFSAAAARRHVSQPAFSRRIQSLEDWLGVRLIDRDRKPLQLTAVASGNEAAFRQLAARIYEFRSLLKSESTATESIRVATQHSLATSALPAFLARLQALSPLRGYRVHTANREQAISALMRGQVDILMVYETPATRLAVEPHWALGQNWGEDELVFVAAPALHRSLRRLPDGGSVPLLCFPPDSYFGELVRVECLPNLMRHHPVSVNCVSEFAIGLRELALIGQGAAWLPRTLVAQDLAQGALKMLPRLGGHVPLSIEVYFGTTAGNHVQALRERFFLEDPRAEGLPPERSRSPRRPPSI